MARRVFTYDTWRYNDSAHKSLVNKVSKFKVHDRFDDETEDYRPSVATFEVSSTWDAQIQELRAQKLCEFLNAVQDKVDVINIMTGMTIAP